MKFKNPISFLILSLLISVTCFSQNIVNRANSSYTVQDSRLAAQYNLLTPRFADSTAANLQKGIDSCGAVVYLYSTHTFWYRSCASSTKKWVEIGSGGGGSGITIGSTTITSGTNTRVLYNNSGVAGEYSISGTGNVAMTTSPLFTTPRLNSTSTTGYVWTATDANGNGSFQAIPSDNLIVRRGGEVSGSVQSWWTSGDTLYLKDLKGSTYIGVTTSADSTNIVSLLQADYGDITVGASTWTIDNDVVTFAKFQNITQARLLGRYTASTGDMQEISIGSGLSLDAGTGVLSATGGGGSGTVTDVSWTGGIVSIATSTTTPAFTIAGTSGGIPYFSSSSTWASSGALTASAIVLGGGAGSAPTSLALGTANQVIGMNNAGTANEYKTISTSTTAVSNDIGVTLSGANAIVINIPDASATVRGVITTGAQTFTSSSKYFGADAYGGTDGNVNVSATFVYGGGATNSEMIITSANNTAGSAGIGFRTNGGTAQGKIWSANSAFATTVAGLSAADAMLWQNLRANKDFFVTTNNGKFYVAPGTSGTAPVLTATGTGVGIGVAGVTSPTAYLHLGAGTTAASTAPLKFTSGTNMTTAETGAVEYNGTNLLFTRTGTTRESVMTANAVNSVSPTAPNRTITVIIDGTTYYISAKTTND